MAFDNGGGSAPDGYTVLTDSLVQAARDVMVTADVVREGTILGLDDTVNVGHDELQGTLAEFASRWQTGAEELIHQQYSIAGRLNDVVGNYLEQEAAAAAAYYGARS